MVTEVVLFFPGCVCVEELGHVHPGERLIMKNFRAALIQADSEVGNKDHNLRKMTKLVRESPADLYIFGELFLSGYMAKDLLPKLAEKLTGPVVKQVRNLAQEANADIIFGMPERDEESGVLYNSSVYISREGETVSYRKLYPANFGPFEELQYFRPGDELTLVNSDLGRLGLLICYDIFFPEVAKALALRGAEVLACISAAPATSKPLFDMMIPARAVENTCYLLYANLVGTELNMVFQGGTQAVGPRGELLGKATDFEEDVVNCTVNPRDVDVAKRFRPTIRDTRTEVLELLLDSLREDEAEEGTGRTSAPS